MAFHFIHRFGPSLSFMKRLLPLITITFIVSAAAGQDTTRVLDELTVQSFLYKRPVNQVPASIGVLRQQDLERFNNTNLLPVANTISGVRMEERSPGSYRFSIRGSLIRSPFGVRNVKVYWNRLPFTDGGGNTYINLIDFSSLAKMEIIKGPGASLYGAGTGGVLLLTSPEPKTSAVAFSSVFGSYGLQRYQLNADLHTKKWTGSVRYAHQQADGYRAQSEMKRDVLQADVRFIPDAKQIFSATVLFSDLFYETPGALTLEEFKKNPKQARPAAGLSPGAVEQNASVTNNTFYAGLSHDYEWNDQWSTYTGLFYSDTDFENFAIRNFEKRDEKNIGLRSETQYGFRISSWQSKLSFGGEYQRFNSPIDIHENNLGSRGALQIADDLRSVQGLLFAQIEFNLNNDLFVTLGASQNFLRYNFKRTEPTDDTHQRNFKPVFSPRVAVLKNLTPELAVFASVSSGFSPPSLAEVRPSTNAYNNRLKPEQGLSYDLGIRGTIGQQLEYDITAYQFQLNETIVLQRTADDADYFINAGETKQRGLEATLQWNVPLQKSGFFSALKIWTSQTYNHYRFSDYVNDDENYSGNKLTGVPPTVALLGIDLNAKAGVYMNITGNYVDHIPLNDANDAYAPAYVLVNIRAGYRTIIQEHLQLDLFAGVDNVTDETYSLGNDLNAFGRRYYNIAPARNYAVGLVIKSIFKRRK
ncbi:MAG TPA: TonB-dependent receptor [Ohtaekwangia sp.]|nr:TonB-dependent receptor [Ohtaekwangia sp.]